MVTSEQKKLVMKALVKMCGSKKKAEEMLLEHCWRDNVVQMRIRMSDYIIPEPSGD